jgi:F0F1-type ATP synthase assembly protein I
MTSRYQQLSGFSLGLSLAIEFAAAVALFWFIGWLLDGWLGTEPWGQVILAVVGWIGGVIHIFVHGERRSKDLGGRSR